jgi:2-polyprenyl-6-hydroxyphenyl methylase / 3-demethylubiquinone-9 3-methyltransferase
MQRQNARVNNAFYEELGEGWYEDRSHPIALLRAENAVRNPWIIKKVDALGKRRCDILDIGCGAGFLSNDLAKAGHRVTGIDLSARSLDVARHRDDTRSVRYLQQDALALSLSRERYDVICAMDFLEHVETPRRIVEDISRLLKPEGLFFFHTFNRTWLSWLIAIQGVEWLVPNTPKNMHLYSYFIKPAELKNWCEASSMAIQEMHGLAPRVASKAFWKSLFMRKVDAQLEFCFTSQLSVGYLGMAQSTRYLITRSI